MKIQFEIRPDQITYIQSILNQKTDQFLSPYYFMAVKPYNSIFEKFDNPLAYYSSIPVSFDTDNFTSYQVDQEKFRIVLRVFNCSVKKKYIDIVYNASSYKFHINRITNAIQSGHLVKVRPELIDFVFRMTIDHLNSTKKS